MGEFLFFSFFLYRIDLSLIVIREGISNEAWVVRIPYYTEFLELSWVETRPRGGLGLRDRVSAFPTEPNPHLLR